MKCPSVLLSIAFFMLVQVSEPSFAKDDAQRPYRLSDQFEREDVSAVTFAPDGRSLIYARTRPISTLPNPMLIDEARSDVWLQEAPEQPPHNLTKGASDQSGWWAPQWSPDGQRLAMLSTRGGEVRLWVWERGTNQLRQVSQHGVEFDNAKYDPQNSYRWIDNARLLYLAYPRGEQALPLALDGPHPGRATQHATAAWNQASRGELTASAVDSLSTRHPERQLVLVDLAAGSAQILAKTRTAGEGRNWWLSPKTHVIALLSLKPTLVAFDDKTADLELYRLDGQPLRLDRSLPSNIATNTLRFSPDGKALAFFAWGEAPLNPALRYGEEAAKDIAGTHTSSLENPARLWQVNLDQGKVEEIDISALDLGRTLALLDFSWMASGELLTRAVRRPAGGAALASAPSEWLVLGRDPVRALSASSNLPDDLQSFDGGKTFIGLRDGEVWRIDPMTGTMISLTENLQPAVSAVAPVGGEMGSQQQLMLSAQRAPKTAYETMLREQNREWSSSFYAMNTYYRLDPVAGTIIALVKPDERAQPVAHDVNANRIAWYTEDRRGTFLWRTDSIGRAEQVLVTNTHLRQVVTGEERVIEYTTLNGETMKARIVLPPGYKKGRRYPLVVDFDIGYTAEGSSEYAARDRLSLPDAYQDPFPAAGYVYMFASWPSTSMDDIGRANLLLGVNSIIPAVEKAIDLGIADPDRLFLFGGSSAGYGVYALVTQTSRFKAAAAHGGWVDQATAPLSISINDRYTQAAFFTARMGAAYTDRRLPVWRIADLLRRNSPLNYVDRVQTPLLILHGNLDFIPITQPEMFFKALVLQRKPARFVRYWGEGHGNKSPANVRDYYQQLFAWYDQWGDIARGADGEMLWDGDRVKSRNGAAAMKPEDYARLDVFGPSDAVH